LEILPPVVKQFVTAQSEIIGGCPSALAMSALVTCSGALHHDFALKMMRHGNWWAHPNLWVLLFGTASIRKTPILDTATLALRLYEAKLREKYQAELKEFKIATKRAKQLGQDPPDNEPESPPRYLTWDVTSEKCGDLLARNDGKGILALCDELSGWLGGMERYNANSGGRADRAFWLKAYDGGPYSVDRIKRGELFIKNLSASLVGAIQPERLAEIRGLTSDGLLQRFIPIIMRAGKVPLDQPTKDGDYSALVQQLIHARPQRLMLADDAIVVNEQIRHHLFNIETATDGMHGGFSSFIGKLSGSVGRLALVLHMAQSYEEGLLRTIVGKETIDHVRRLIVEFIIPHAREFYIGTGTVEAERLRTLASWVLTSGKPRIVASDLTSNIVACRGLKLMELNGRVSTLVAAGWLEPEDKTPVCRAWKVSPAVQTQFAERRRLEDERKSALATLMGRL
jgi:hypothetical protein